MADVLLLLPVPAASVGAWHRFVQLLGTTHVAAYTRSRQRVGIEGETLWAVPLAYGEMAFLQVRNALPTVSLHALASSPDPFDQWFRRSLHRLTGVDLAHIAAGHSATQLYSWESD